MVDFVHEHVVTLKSYDDLENFYQDMETEGGDLYIPDRQIEVTHKRPISRNTNYMLTYEEADQLRQDPRVESVSLLPNELGYVPIAHYYTQTSDAWDKSSSTAATMKNWGLLRCTLPESIFTPQPWGSNTPSANPVQSATITVPASGRNVDVIIVDGFGFPDHPEFDTRYIQYNWYQHNPEVTGGAVGTYLYNSYTGNDNNHGTHTSGTVAGNTQGWARSANIYNIYYSSSVTPVEYLIDYIREFHRTKPVNPETGRKNPTICNNSWGYGINNWTSSLLASIRSVDHQGVNITPESLGNVATSKGQSGFYTATTRRVTLQGNLNTGTRLTSNTVNPGLGGGSSIPFELRGGAGLASSTTPDVFDAVGGVNANDDGYWQLDLPFSIYYLGDTYTSIYVGTNSYITFGSGSMVIPTGIATPPLPKIMINAADLSCQRIYYGVEGVSGTRTYTVRWEGTAATSGTLGSPNMVWEAKFYEEFTNRVDIRVGQNAQYSAVFTTANLAEYGLLSAQGQGIPARVASLDADIVDAISEGIIFVASAGNDYFKIDVPGGTDYDNKINLGGQSVVYYHRGSSPGSAAGAICVGAIGTTGNENKANYSNTGPRVDIYAPGTSIISSTYNQGLDTGSGFYSKFSGTSMAGPQVTGVLACLLEVYPRLTQSEALVWLLQTAGNNKITETLGSGFTYSNNLWLQGGNNKYLYFKNPRELTGSVFPNVVYKPRPATGMVYPRPNIYRSL